MLLNKTKRGFWGCKLIGRNLMHIHKRVSPSGLGMQTLVVHKHWKQCLRAEHCNPWLQMADTGADVIQTHGLHASTLTFVFACFFWALLGFSLLLAVLCLGFVGLCFVSPSSSGGVCGVTCVVAGCLYEQLAANLLFRLALPEQGFGGRWENTLQGSSPACSRSLAPGPPSPCV